MSRTDTASRTIKAPPAVVYKAFVDPVTLVSWLPPEGMTAQIIAFDPKEGGVFELALAYDAPEHAAPGKTSPHVDIVRGRFVELIPDARIVQDVGFDSQDPAFAGTMTISWILAAVPDGTAVTVRCENVPAGVAKEDHDAGLRSSLSNLAALTERAHRS